MAPGLGRRQGRGGRLFIHGQTGSRKQTWPHHGCRPLLGRQVLAKEAALLGNISDHMLLGVLVRGGAGAGQQLGAWVPGVWNPAAAH